MSDTNSLKFPDQPTGPTLSVDPNTTKTLDAAGHVFFERIGIGGMGEVYRCADDALQRDLAIKILRDELGSNADARERFLREARLTGSLQHPGIVPVHHLGRLADGRPYYTMKLVRGRTLSDLLRDEPETPERLPRLLAILEKVCQAVAYAHSKHVLHRDLKPSNVMVGEFGEVQVMDWGLAKELSGREPSPPTEPTESVETAAWMDEGEGLSRAGSALGTPAYMPPEQAAGDWDIVDERADVFALGAILCEILTGRPPYYGANRDDLLRRARRGDLAEALGKVERCGPDVVLVELCRDCLAAERLPRPRHAGVVAARLAAYQADVQERLRRLEVERAAANAKALEERKRRHVALALAAAVLALVIVGGSAASWWIIERRATEQEVLTALEDATKQRDKGHWSEARAALERAAGRLGSWGLNDLRQRVERARIDADMVADLDEIRLTGSDPRYGRGTQGDMKSDAAYQTIFVKYGIDANAQTPQEAASIIEQSPIRTELLAGLYDWLRIKPAGEREPLRALLEAADEDAWRRSFRVAVLAQEIPQLKTLASQPEALSQPPAVQFWLAEKLRTTGGIKEAESLLRQGQRQNPADFWLNYQLGVTLLYGDRTNIGGGGGRLPEEAAGYFRAAIALRPKSSAAHMGLGGAIYGMPHVKRVLDDAAAEFRQAITLDSNSAHAHNGLALMLDLKQDYQASIDEYRKAITLDPKFAMYHNNLARVLLRQNNLDGAIVESQQAIALDSTYRPAYVDLGLFLWTKGDLDGAVSAYRRNIALDPKADDAYLLLIYVLEDKGDFEGAVAVARRQIALNPKGGYVSLTWLLANSPERQSHKPQEAIASAKKALELDPNFGLAKA
jgi:serine/threonine-protein kinase